MTKELARSAQERLAAKPWSRPAFIAFWLVLGAVLFFAGYNALTDAALREASQIASETIGFARKSVKRHEENIYSSRTKSVTSVWEKLEELEGRFDVADASKDEQVEEYLKRTNLHAVFLLDADLQLVRSLGDTTAVDAVLDTVTASGGLDDLVSYPAKSYLSRATVGDTTYDYAICSTGAVAGGLIVGVNRVEKTDVNGGQLMFNAMFDNYAFAMDGTVVVASGDTVLASNDPDVLGIDRTTFDAELSLDGDYRPEALAAGTFNGTSIYGLRTTSNGYDVFVWFPAHAVLGSRNMTLAVGVVMYLGAVLAIFAISVNAQNARLRREHEYLDDLRRANAAKTDFLRRMSHDVRTPINGIRGMLAIGDHYASDMGKQAECRAKMWEASSFLLELVNSALDMNKLESGEMRFENKPFDLHRTVKSVFDVLEVQADSADIEFTTKIDIMHGNLMGSSLHVRQVLQNIGGNAIKYNRPGGSVHMECREIGRVGSLVTYQFVCADTGIGMSEEFQKHAYDAFTQEDGAARGTYRGTGLGLAIAKEIVEQMGGTISFTSVKDEGTVFTIELSFAIDATAAAHGEDAALERDISLKGLRVLLAEDNDLNAEIASFILEQEGMAVEFARDGQEAVEKFRTSPDGYYDLVLMDVMMPVMDGMEAARAIRLLRTPYAQNVPIIAVTANAFSDDRERSAAAGMNGHVSKPLDADKLIRVMRECLR